MFPRNQSYNSNGHKWAFTNVSAFFGNVIVLLRALSGKSPLVTRNGVFFHEHTCVIYTGMR